VVAACGADGCTATGSTCGAALAGTAGGVTFGVIVTLATFPEIDAFFFFDVVPRASRVAFAFAVLAASSTDVRGAGALGGFSPNNASVAGEFAYIARSTRFRAEMIGPVFVFSAAYATSASLTLACAESTAVSAVIRP
jgi:hypothetical protein